MSALVVKDMLGRVLAVMFAVFCIFGALGGGSMFQANQAHMQLVGVTGGDATFSLGTAGYWSGSRCGRFLVIVGGIKSIATVTEKIVPLMTVLYVISALVIILMHIDKIGWAFGEIFEVPSPTSACRWTSVH